jgi:kinesin family protein 6/9
LKDLLDPQKKVIKIFSTSDGVVVQNLSKIICENLEDVMKLLIEGKKIRVVGSHNMNSKSSRSHAIFTIFVKQKLGQTYKVAKLNIVDLAGSERHSKT